MYSLNSLYIVPDCLRTSLSWWHMWWRYLCINLNNHFAECRRVLMGEGFRFHRGNSFSSPGKISSDATAPWRRTFVAAASALEQTQQFAARSPRHSVFTQTDEFSAAAFSSDTSEWARSGGTHKLTDWQTCEQGGCPFMLFSRWRIIRRWQFESI